MSSPHRLAFLLANWYSGATVLNILLNNHSQVVSNGEAFPFHIADRTDYTCSCGQSLAQCEFYRGAASHMFDTVRGDWNRDLFAQIPHYSSARFVNRWLQSYRRLHRLRDFMLGAVPWYARRHSAFKAAHDEFFRKATSRCAATLYLDGTKSFRRAEMFADQAAAVLYVVRDGRGFCNSYRKHHEVPAHELGSTARLWLDHIAAFDILVARYPKLPMMAIRYEDLCHDLEGTMRKACETLGLPFDERVLGQQLDEYHLLGNRMRMSFDGKVKEDLSWQTELRSEEILSISNIMKPALERFAYI